MLVKLLIIIGLLSVIFVLFRGLFFLTKGTSPDKLYQALKWRIALSILVFTFIMAAIGLVGWSLIL